MYKRAGANRGQCPATRQAADDDDDEMKFNKINPKVTKVLISSNNYDRAQLLQKSVFRRECIIYHMINRVTTSSKFIGHVRLFGEQKTGLNMPRSVN